MNIGMHTGQQDCAFEDLRRVWRIADDNGFAWVSIWDHFYEAPYVDGGSPTYETVSTMAALASETKTVRVGCLVYSVGYRPPALMAKMITTVDHISNGRANLGLGAGWHAAEYEAYGYEFPPPKTRLDMLEESVQIVKGMLTEGRSTFEGQHYRAADAQLVLARPRVVVGEPRADAQRRGAAGAQARRRQRLLPWPAARRDAPRRGHGRGLRPLGR